MKTNFLIKILFKFTMNDKFLKLTSKIEVNMMNIWGQYTYRHSKGVVNNVWRK